MDDVTYFLSMVFNMFPLPLPALASYGEGCAMQNSPGVYTRVSFFRHWIRTKACAEGYVIIPFGGWEISFDGLRGHGMQTGDQPGLCAG